ncbi:unnamed protein product [Ectocarpus sp. 12 AP-2014]
MTCCTRSPTEACRRRRGQECAKGWCARPGRHDSRCHVPPLPGGKAGCGGRRGAHHHRHRGAGSLVFAASSPTRGVSSSTAIG